MALVRQPLAFGQVPLTEGTLYTAPADIQGSIKNALWFNNHTSAVTLKLYLDTGTKRQIWEKIFQPKERLVDHFLGVGKIIPAEGVLSAEASVGAVLTYKLDGSEEGAVVGVAGFQNVLATKFDGSNEYINVGDFMNFEYTDPFSVVFWAKPKPITSQYWGALIGRQYRLGPPFGWFVVIIQGTGKMRFQLMNNWNGNNEVVVEAPTVVTDDVYRHYAITWDGSGSASGANIYMNSAAESLSTITDNLSATILNSNDAYIGAGSGTGDPAQFYNGLMDAVGVYDKELSSGEVAEIYAGGTVVDLRTLSTELDLIHYWRMGDDELVAALTDLVGSADGILVNMSRENFMALVP